MSKPLSFSALQTGGKSPRQCAVCGEPNAGAVRIGLVRYEHGRAAPVTSKSVSRCERHAIEVYQHVLADITDPSGRL